MAGRPLRRARMAVQVTRNGPGYFRWRRNGDPAAHSELDFALSRNRRRRNRPPMPDDIPMSTYPSMMSDYDADGIPDVDDPHPYQPGDTESIEEVKLSEEIGELLKARRPFIPAKDTVLRGLERVRAQIGGGKVEGRVKSPYSIINKLRRKRLFGPQGLHDIAATRIIVKDADRVEQAKDLVLHGAVGGVVEHEDFYETPQNGYRAHHFIVMIPGPKGKLLPVEVQVKTQRMMELNEASHEAFKRGRLNAEEMDRVARLADAADRGDEKAARAFQTVAADAETLTRRLTL